MNITIAENGLVKTCLVFGVIPTFPIISTDTLTQNEGMETIAAAQTDMSAIIAEGK